MARLRSWNWLLVALASTFVLAGITQLAAQQIAPDSSLIEGTVYDSVTRSPVRLVTVRLAGTEHSTLTDDAGHYRLIGPVGEIGLDARRIGYQPIAVRLVTATGPTHRDLFLHPIAIGLATI